MKTELFLQANGAKLRDVLRNIADPRSLRIATAYVSGDTPAILADFAAIPKTVLVDYDPFHLTEKLLLDLIAVPNCETLLADLNELFHPKVYMIDAAPALHLAIGSNNATHGGLERNVEVVTYSVLNRKKDSALVAQADSLWEDLRSIASTRLTRQLVKQRRSELAAQLPTRRRNRHAAPLRVQSRSILLALPRTLYKVVGRETGAGGTQVQFPVEAIREFFGNDGSTNERFIVRYGHRRYPVQLTHQRHNMHRIVLSFLDGVPRPALLRLERTSYGYEANIYDQNDKRFAMVQRTGRRARQDANPFLVIP